jgi:mannose-6-phosphate isomerase-like protein (cupin superfamily)
MTEIFDLGQVKLRLVLATDAITILEGVIEAGNRGTWHRHSREDETFLVVEGSITIYDDVAHLVEIGQAHLVRRGVRHFFANEGDAPALVYFFCCPGGLERFFRDVAAGGDVVSAAERAGLEVG